MPLHRYIGHHRYISERCERQTRYWWMTWTSLSSYFQASLDLNKLLLRWTTDSGQTNFYRYLSVWQHPYEWEGSGWVSSVAELEWTSGILLVRGHSFLFILRESRRRLVLNKITLLVVISSSLHVICFYSWVYSILIHPSSIDRNPPGMCRH